MQTLSQLLGQIQQYTSEQVIVRNPVGLYEPIEYILQIGGKKLRPALVLMSYNLYEEEVSRALPAGFAIEVFHNFTLMHDDIMDDAPLRRGQTTVHEKYNVNTGILSGDAMLILAYDYLMSASDESSIAAKIIKVFNKCALEVCEGQQYDIDFEKRNNVTISEYLHMIQLKTSVLLAAALEIGAILGKSSDIDAKNLYEFGKNIGIAFQLQDDILDTFGDPEKFGKKVGGDIAQNKKTYLYLKALDVADEADKAELLRWYNDDAADESSKITAVRKSFTKLNIVAHANALKDDFYAKAMQNLDAVAVPAAKKEVLRAFAEELLHRNV